MNKASWRFCLFDEKESGLPQCSDRARFGFEVCLSTEGGAFLSRDSLGFYARL